MKKLLSTLLSIAIFATLTTPAFAERELTVADGPLWNDLVSYFNLNGDIIDQTGITSPQFFDNNGALTAPVTFQAGKIGQGAAYDNTGADIAIGFPGIDSGAPQSPLSFGGDITISMWIKATNTTTGGWAKIWSDWDGPERNILIMAGDHGGQASSPRIQGSTGNGLNGQAPLTVRVAADFSDWIHLVYQRDGNTQRMFINGALPPQYSDANLTVPYNGDITGYTGAATNHNVGLGGDVEEDDYHFQGSIDDVAIWDQALTATEILQLYNMGISPLNATTEYTAAGTTDFEAETDMTSVSNVALYKALDTGVVFSGDMNPKNKDYDNTVKMGPGYITVNSTANPELDRAATVTMNVNTCNDLAIYKDDSFIEDPGNYASIKDRIIDQGTECTLANSCLTTAPTCSGNTATFYVTGFSSFAGEGSGGSGSSVPEFSDYMLMLTFLIAGFALYRKMPELQK